MIRQAKTLKHDEGILATPRQKVGKSLSADIEHRVENFYHDDEFSWLCPGKKDYTSVHINGKKVQKQKCLILCNLKELWLAYQQCYGPEIGFSKFCDLCPKWCITVGSAGTHSVCVCTIHQNVKLMLSAAHITDDYKTLLEKSICNLDSKHCMLHRSEFCPGKEALEKYLSDLLNDLDPDEPISFKQWIYTDCDTLHTCQLSTEEFIAELSTKLFQLTSHHFNSKHRSSYLRIMKENLVQDSIIILMDFAENYSFIVQDAVHGFHWENSQATLHPFVLYFSSGSELQNMNCCIISDCLQHDTIAVHAFLRALIEFVTEHHSGIKYMHYFSDGSAA